MSTFHAAILAAVAGLWPCAGATAQDARQLLVIPHTNAVNAAAFSSDGKTILTGGQRNTLREFDAASGKELRTFSGGPDTTIVITGDGGLVNSVRYSADGGRVLSTHSDASIRLWDTATGALLRVFRGHQFAAKAAVFAPDGRTALSGGLDNTVRYWDVETGAQLAVFKVRVQVEAVAFMPGGRVAISAGYGDTRLWDLAAGRELQVYMPWGLAIAPDGKFILVSSVADPFEARDPNGLWEVRAYRFAQQRASVLAYALSPDGHTLLMGVGDEPVLWDTVNAREIHRFQRHTSPFIQVVAFSPDGNTILSGADDQTLRLWDVRGLMK